MKKHKVLTLAIALLLVIGSAFFLWDNQVRAIGSIIIDVNPSIEMVVQKDNKVSGVLAKNSEAEALLQNYTLGEDQEVYQVAEDLTELLIQNGYLGLDVENHILISGDIEETYLNSTKAAMQSTLGERDMSANFMATVLSDDDDQADDVASAGKIKLSKTIAELTGDLSVDELKNLTLGELFNLMNEVNQGDDQLVSNPSTHIGIDKAEELALAHLGLNQSDVYDRDHDDLDDGQYELEFKVNGVEYEVKVHSRTGEILKVEIDDKDDDDRQGSVPSTHIGIKKAEELVLAHLGLNPADVYDRDHDDLDDGQYELEFKVNGVEYEVNVHSRTGEILKVEVDDRDDDDRPVSNPITPTLIGAEKAKQIAFTHVGVSASSVRDLEVDLDDGHYEIEFEVGDREYEIDIHGTTGAILKSEIDD